MVQIGRRRAGNHDITAIAYFCDRPYPSARVWPPALAAVQPGHARARSFGPKQDNLRSLRRRRADGSRTVPAEPISARTRRILLDGVVTQVVEDGGTLRAADGRQLEA